MGGRPVLLVVYDDASVTPTALVRTAKRNECDIVFVLAESPFAREMQPVLRLLGPVVDMAGQTEAALARELRAFRPAAIVTFSETQIANTARIAESLALEYHPIDSISVITSKDAQRARLAERGVDDVRFERITSLAQIDQAVRHTGLPAVVKPVVGVASRNTFVVSTIAECRDAVTQLLGVNGDDNYAEPTETAIVLEELLPGRPTTPPWGDYIAVDCIASGDDVRPMFVTSKFELARPFRERGGYGGASAVDEPTIGQACDLACRAVRALGIRQGIADVEIKLTPRGPRVIEVNGRLGGWVDDLAVRTKSADPTEIAIRCALRRDYQPPRLINHGPIVFHYLIMPPYSATRVRSIHDIARLRRLKHVDRVVVRARPGMSVGWRLGSGSGVAAVLGMTDDLGQLAETIAEIENADWIDYE